MTQQLSRLDTLSEESLRRLHRGVFEDPTWIRTAFERLRDNAILLDNGVDRSSVPRTARVVWVAARRAGLAVSNIRFGDYPQIYLRFTSEGVAYFCAVPPVREADGVIEIELPRAVYEAERRDLPRGSPGELEGGPARVRLRGAGFEARDALVRDWSHQGIGVVLPKADARDVESSMEVQFLDGTHAGLQCYGTVRYRDLDPLNTEWVRLGIATTSVPTPDLVSIERRSKILGGGPNRRTWRRVVLAAELARHASARIVDRFRNRAPLPVEVASYTNHQSQPIRAIVNRTRNWKNGTVVVIPPAWGKTKETLLPLALTLIRSFERAGEPLVVIRFDGTNRRGESYVAPDCLRPGTEYLRFTFSGAVQDIEATINFVYGESGFCPKRVVLLTTSLSAIEGRRALALDGGDRIHGWISLVGMVDLQSGLRSVSGGVDYAYGLTRGVRFGRHELVGVVADMDWTGHDALQHDLVFAEHARRDMALIDVPVTWIHGRHDAWMSLDRVRRLMSAGDTSKRRLLEVPIGHQMRTSREALEAFQLVAEEVAWIGAGRRIESVMPNLSEMRSQTKAERARVPTTPIDLRRFWEDYLLGRDRRVGIKLMTSTKAYRELMSLQVGLLDLFDDARVLDLGSGTGDFSLALGRHLGGLRGISVTEIDYVAAALRDSRAAKNSGVSSRQIISDLNLGRECGLPVRPQSFDAVLASLLISYVDAPRELLVEIGESLVSGGRLVISSLRPDADISRIYAEGMAELPPDRVKAMIGSEAAHDFEALQRSFLNDAARILTLEESGIFRFWDADELASEVRSAGFKEVRSHSAFGDPPQAVIVSAVKA